MLNSILSNPYILLPVATGFQVLGIFLISAVVARNAQLRKHFNG